MTLKAAQIDEDEYFARMVSDNVERILKELKQARSGDQGSAAADDADSLKECIQTISRTEDSDFQKWIMIFRKQIRLPPNFGRTGIHKIRQSKKEPVCGRMKSTAGGFLCIRDSESRSKGSFGEKSAHPERKAGKRINNFRCITEVSKVEVFVQQI